MFSPIFIEYAFPALMQMEGGYSDSAIDHGGATFMGISSRYWPKEFAAIIAQKDPELRRAMVQCFYWEHFWLRFGCDDIDDKFMALKTFEFAVNAESGSRTVSSQTCAWLRCNSIEEATRKYGVLVVMPVYAYYQMKYYLLKVSKDHTQIDNLPSWCGRVIYPFLDMARIAADRIDHAVKTDKV